VIKVCANEVNDIEEITNKTSRTNFCFM
jgi:hypothetical protein